MVDPIVKTVVDMMKRRGGDAQFISSGVPTYDPATSTAISGEVIYPVRALVFDYVAKSLGMGVQGDSLVRSGDKQVFIQPSNFPRPIAKVDSFMYQGSRFSVIVAKEINPSGDNVLLHELHVRL